MTLPDWDQLTWYHYLGVGGGVVVILALLMYFTRASRIKVPAILMAILGGMGVGVVLGAVATITASTYASKMEEERTYEGIDKSAPPFGKGGKGGPKGGKGGFGMGGTRGPNSKTQLASLIAKLDLLTSHPLSVKLDAEQKQKVAETLQKLDEEKELSEDEARTKLEALGKILTEDQRKTLDAAGYRWPGQGQGGGGRGGAPAAPPNPFSEGENHDHLTSLRAQLK
jgi:hypothetical protein